MDVSEFTVWSCPAPPIVISLPKIQRLYNEGAQIRCPWVHERHAYKTLATLNETAGKRLWWSDFYSYVALLHLREQLLMNLILPCHWECQFEKLPWKKLEWDAPLLLAPNKLFRSQEWTRGRGGDHNINQEDTMILQIYYYVVLQIHGLNDKLYKYYTVCKLS